MQRVILHFDLDAFFCAVEEQYDPSLVGVPFAVGGDSAQRGVVASCSYAARMYGVRSAQPMIRAKKLCPELKVISQNRKAYSDYSHKVMSHLLTITPMVEQLSIDEAFLDVTGLRGTGADIARRIQRDIQERINLPCSIGVASNKLVAKTANNIGKGRHRAPHPPRAIEVVMPGTEAAYLAPLPIRELWGVGAKTAEHMEQLDIHTIGDIARQTEQFMMHHFGKSGFDFWQRAQGIDTRPVEPEHDAKSISRETTFARDISDRDELQRVLRKLAEDVGRRLRREQISGATIQVKLRWHDFTTITRQTTLSHPTQDDKTIIDTALKLFRENWRGQAVRLVGVGISNLEQAQRQLSLWESDESAKSRKLQSTLDDLRDRFGDQSVQRLKDMTDNDHQS